MADLFQNIQAGIAGQSIDPNAPAKSTVAADVATQQVGQQKKALLSQAQEVQQKQKTQAESIATTEQLSVDQMKQRENSMLQNVNRQINDLHSKLYNQRLDMNNDQQAAQLEQLTFLNNLSNRKWADTVKTEGAKRRLDNEGQMKEALLYANFDDMMGMLNSDIEFKKMINADERTFLEKLATITPQAALDAAVQIQKDANAAASIQGAVKGVTAGAQTLAESGKPAEWLTPAAPVQEPGSGVIAPDLKTYGGIPATLPKYTP